MTWARRPYASPTVEGSRPPVHVCDGLAHRGDGVGPGQEDVGLLGRDLLGVVAEPAEVEGWAGAGHRADPGGVEFQIHEVAVEVDRFAVQQCAEDLHPLQRPLVPRGRFERLPRDVGGDDVDGQATVQHLVDGGQLPGQLWNPHLAHAHGAQQLHVADLGGDRAGEGDGVDSQLIAGRQQDVVVAGPVRRQGDVAAVFVAGLQRRIRLSEELVIVVAQGAEPGNLHRRRRVADGRHGSGAPWEASMTS